MKRNTYAETKICKSSWLLNSIHSITNQSCRYYKLSSISYAWRTISLEAMSWHQKKRRYCVALKISFTHLWDSQSRWWVYQYIMLMCWALRLIDTNSYWFIKRQPMLSSSCNLHSLSGSLFGRWWRSTGSSFCLLRWTLTFPRG